MDGVRAARPAAAGIAAAAAGLGAGELVAAVFTSSASPLLSVGSLVVDLAPPFVKSAVISAFGTGDKPFLVVLLLVLLLVLGAAAGLLQRRRPPWGLVLVAAAGLLAGGAAVTRTGASPLDATPAVIAAAVGAWVLTRLARVAGAADGQGRRLLIGAGTWTVLGVVAGAVAQGIGSGARSTQQAIRSLRLPAASSARPRPPAAASLDVRGITPLVSDNDGFYRIDIALAPPSIDPDQWVLEITGEVERPQRFTYEQVSALAVEQSATTLMCVSNPVGGTLNGTAVWQGVPIRSLLAAARPRSGADMVLSSGADGFTASTPLSVLQDPDRASLLAIGMNGQVLPQLHGFPARMVVPGLYGYVSATKWITSMEVTRFSRATAYWTTRGYSALGPVKLSSRIDVPAGGARAGVVEVAGVAWAQHTGIARVQLQVDDGPWRDCVLAEAWTADVWRQWRYRWTATAGAHRLRVRAVDADGLVQTAALAGEAPDGATGLHTVTLQVA